MPILPTDKDTHVRLAQPGLPPAGGYDTGQLELPQGGPVGEGLPGGPTFAEGAVLDARLHDQPTGPAPAAPAAAADFGGMQSIHPLAFPSQGMAPGIDPGAQFGGPQFQAGGRARIPGMDVQQEQGRLAQQQLSNILYQAALGGGPSAAQDLLAGQREQALLQQQRMGALGGAAGLREAQLSQAQTEAGLGREASMLRAREQQAGQQMLGQQLGQMRGQDLAQQQLASQLLEQGAARDIGQALQQAQVMMGMGGQELQAAGLGVQADVAQQRGLLDAAEQQRMRDQAINELLLRVLQGNTGQLQQQQAGQMGLLGGLLSLFGAG